MSLKTRKTGLAILGDVPWGSHLCLFHETKQDLLDAVIPYFRAGLENNEFCVWAVSSPLNEDEARKALDQGIPSFGDRAAGVEIIPGRQWYLGDGQVDPARITKGWQAKLGAALAQGYEGIRVSGNAFWLGTAYWNAFREYEQQVNGAFAGSRMIALCTYPFTASRATDVLDVARAHGVAVARRNGHWELIETAEAQHATHSLTPREREVLTWVARGKSAADIGKILLIAKRTVDEHVQSAKRTVNEHVQTVVRKLAALNRTHAVAIAVRDGIVKV